MRPPIRIRYRTYELQERNGARRTVLGRYMSRWEAQRAKTALAGQYHNLVIVRRWA